MTNPTGDALKASAMQVLPCPFCGNQPRLVEPHESDRSIDGATDEEEWLSFIECECVDMFFVKGSSSSQEEVRAEVVSAWNRRTKQAVTPTPPANHVNGGAYRRISVDEWRSLGGDDNKFCDWHEGIGYVVYDDQALAEYLAKTAALSPVEQAPQPVAAERVGHRALDLVEQSGDILVKYGLAPHAWDEAGREALEAAASEIIVLARLPSAPTPTEAPPVEQSQAAALTLAKDLRSWSNWVVSCACGNVSDEARLLLDAADALEGKYMSSALDDVIAERRRQIEIEGWTLGHDDAHADGELARAASCYAYFGSWTASDRRMAPNRLPRDWPWERTWWKPTDSRRDLVKAAALIIAEIERLDRAALAAEGSAE